MLKKTKFAIALVVALSAIGVAASSASAITASVANAGAVNATGTATFEGSGLSIVCPLTLRTSLLRGPITLAANAQIGEVSEVTIGSCTGGSVERVLNTPWRLTIRDTLPTLTSLTTRNATGVLVNIVGSAFLLSTFGGALNCLYRGNAGALMPMTHTAPESTTYTARSLEALRATELPLFSGEAFCPRTGHFAGNFTLSAVQTITLA
ncbi:MAG: hypothetical protein ACTHOE_13545 [Conexibacter sp.]